MGLKFGLSRKGKAAEVQSEGYDGNELVREEVKIWEAKTNQKQSQRQRK